MSSSARTLLLQPTPEDLRIARLATAAIVLSVAEAAIPLPLPGVKPGLGNIVVVLVALCYGWRAAAWVSGLRVLATSLVLGTFLAPGFFFSLGGACASMTMLALTLRLPSRWFGPVTHSVLGSFAHMGAQLLIARFWLVPHDGVFYLLPVFAGSALLFGLVNGLVVGHLLPRFSGFPSSETV